MKSRAIWTARTVLISTGLVGAGGGLAGVALASTHAGLATGNISMLHGSVVRVPVVIAADASGSSPGGANVGGKLPPPPSGPTLPGPGPKPTTLPSTVRNTQSAQAPSASGSLPATGMYLAGILTGTLGLLGA